MDSRIGLVARKISRGRKNSLERHLKPYLRKNIENVLQSIQKTSISDQTDLDQRRRRKNQRTHWSARRKLEIIYDLFQK